MRFETTIFDKGENTSKRVGEELTERSISYRIIPRLLPSLLETHANPPVVPLGLRDGTLRMRAMSRTGAKSDRFKRRQVLPRTDSGAERSAADDDEVIAVDNDFVGAMSEDFGDPIARQSLDLEDF